MKNNMIKLIVVSCFVLTIGSFYKLYGSYNLCNDAIEGSYPLINVVDFGAKGDGVHDDSEAIQRALDRGAGKTVFFPKGNYSIGKTLLVTSGTELKGEGDVGSESGSAILPLLNKKLDAIFSSKSNSISDVIFRNIRTLKTRYGFYFNTKNGFVTKVKWYNCVFQEHEVCINVSGSKINGMYANIIRDSYFKASKFGVICEGPYNINVIQACGFENMGLGYLKLCEGSTPSLSNTFSENRCESVSIKKGIGIELARSVYGFYIRGNFYENSHDFILKTNGANNVDVENNTYTNSDNKFGSILINGGSASIKNNFSLTGFILDITENGFCSEIIGNGFLNYSDNVKPMNLGKVNNQYNRVHNK